MRLSPSHARFSSFALACFTSLLRFQGKCVPICKCIMPNSNLFVAGSIHQGHERFSDISRGRQCSFMSFSALLLAQSLPIEHQILTKGNQLYLDALKSRSIPDTETLSLDYLPNAACWSVETNNSNDLPVEAQTHDSRMCAEMQTNDQLLRADIESESPVTVTNTDLPAVEPNYPASARSIIITICNL